MRVGIAAVAPLETEGGDMSAILRSRRGRYGLLVALAGAVALVGLLLSPAVRPAQTAAVAEPSPTGCPTDKSTKPINVSQVAPPAHLVIDEQEVSPSPITGDTQQITLRVHITACGGRSIGGALVYETATPYEQFSEDEVPTKSDGWATIQLHSLRFFPVSNQQQLLIVFLRARKDGEDLLAGISARRLVSFPVSLG